MPETKYKPEYDAQAEKLCRLGATNIEIGDFFGVSDRTVKRWAVQHESFCNALKTGKEVADERVERSLFNRAVGYTFKAEKVFQYQGTVVRAPTEEHVPPDTIACIFWLKNRRPGLWRDVHKHEHGGPGDFSDMSDDELRQKMEEEAAALSAASDATQH